jgi:hypothetical protein
VNTGKNVEPVMARAKANQVKNANTAKDIKVIMKIKEKDNGQSHPDRASSV